MTTSGRSEGPARGSSSKSACKRKLEESEVESPSRSRKQHRSIAELLTVSQQSEKASRAPASPGTRSRRGKTKRLSDSPSTEPGFSDMYHFEPSRPKPNGVVDLTNSPPSSSSRPQSTPFSSQT